MTEPLAAPATSLVKALRVLLALEDSPQGRGVSDIARALHLPKSAVHRLLVTFQACGFVQQQAASSRYTLGPVLARLGLRTADLCTPRRAARPHMQALAAEVRESVFLGVLCETQILVVEKVEQGQGLRLAPEVGTTLPLLHTSLGLIWLACCDPTQRDQLLATLLPLSSPTAPARPLDSWHQELRSIAQQGFALSMETWMPDLCCIAVPVRTTRGELVAALAITVPRSRLPQPPRHDPFAQATQAQHAPAWLPALVRTTERISAALP
ncbi:MAG: IclR family transcriptional regulator [Candidatus Tectimicrobiota bacterium]